VNLVFDTSALSALFDDEDNVVKAISRHTFDRAIVPLATDAEMRFGFAYGNKTNENLKNYRIFMEHLNFEIVCPDKDTSSIYAELAAWLRKRGLSLSMNDIWIAATCIQSGGTLATFDKDFANLPQIFQVDLSRS
jgi:tRNA(fMet)-specific endonuclease VapC